MGSLREWGGAPIRLWDTRIIIVLHLSFCLHPWQGGKRAGQAWAPASWVRWMPGCGSGSTSPGGEPAIHSSSGSRGRRGGEIWTRWLGSTEGIS